MIPKQQERLSIQVLTARVEPNFVLLRGQKGELVLTTEHQSTRRFSPPMELDSDCTIDRKRLADALADLHRLLEEYSPSWYTQEHHQKAESALQLTRKV